MILLYLVYVTCTSFVLLTLFSHVLVFSFCFYFARVLLGRIWIASSMNVVPVVSSTINMALHCCQYY